MVCVNTVFAQKTQKAKPRDLFIQKENDESKGKAGAKIRILLKRGTEKERYVAPTETFYSGDKIKLAFDINFSGYAALLNAGTSGRIALLYPYIGTDGKISPGDKEQMIPSNPKDWITFDNQPGTELITIVFSANPIEKILDVIEMSKTDSNSSAGSQTGAAGSPAYSTAGGEAQATLRDLNTRSLQRSKSRDLYVETVSNDATYVVAETDLISEPTAFLITLKHELR